jgi:4-amino-4-deoxy-L-arabinose transferase-like glycosyltransferase
MNNPFKKEIFILFLCLIIGFALRFYTFDQKSLWLDEIHTFNESRDDLKGQLNFYKEYPTHLQPPLFFVLSHLFYPFTKPERDLRIIPLIFGVLSIPMIYFLSRMFSPVAALPCTLSLTFMAYHISLSQEGRSYALLMFLGMLSLYLFMIYMKTNKIGFLISVSCLLAIMFLTSYSAIPFIVFIQILCFYWSREDGKSPRISFILLMNMFILFILLPWFLFVLFNYPAKHLSDPYDLRFALSLQNILYGLFHDWTPHLPLMIASVVILLLFPFVTDEKRKASILLSFIFFPVLGLYLFCRIFNVSHFITSRYFICFLPLFLITLYLSIEAIERKFTFFKKYVRLHWLFLFLFIASNVVILPFYYRSEKQDFRRVARYLQQNIRNGDVIYLGGTFLFPGIFHYFGILPKGRHYELMTYHDSQTGIEFVMMPLFYKKVTIPVYYSKRCCSQYVVNGNRLWIVVGGKRAAGEIMSDSPAVLKGFFDGSFLNYNRFPTDASIYLFLWDPKSPDENGIDIHLESRLFRSTAIE